MADKIIYGVQLHPCGQVCYFLPGSYPELQKGDRVIVRIDRGEALAEIVRIFSPRQGSSPSPSPEAELRPVPYTGPEDKAPSFSPEQDTPHPLAEDTNEEQNDSRPEKGKKQPFTGEPFQWEVWDGDEQEEDRSGSEAELCLDPNSPDLQPILRPASHADLEKADANQALAKKAHCFCVHRARHHNLEMKMVQAECLLDCSKIIFYFTAPNRIDFRELVKDLVKEFRTRIELRQIGVRHETQMVGATGNCGMVCCCRRYMRRFAPVTIKMAKEQNLFLNPTKISGTCGRLLCCLAFEQEAYEEFHSRCPKMGKKYITNAGVIKVLRSSIFRNTLSLLPEEGDEYEVSLEDWQAMDPVRQGQIQQPKKQASKPVEQAESPEPQNGDRNTHQPGQRQERNRDRRKGDRHRGGEPTAPKQHSAQKPEEQREEAMPPTPSDFSGQPASRSEEPERADANLGAEPQNNFPHKDGGEKSVGLARFLAATRDDE